MGNVIRAPFYLRRLTAFCAGRPAVSEGRLGRTNDRFIFCFHRVLPQRAAVEKRLHHSMWVSPDSFERLLSWVREVGVVVSLADAADFSLEFAKPVFAFTFDDGWRDNLDYAVPALVRYNIPATFFVVTSALSTGELFWADSFVDKMIRGLSSRAALVTWGRENLKASPPALSVSLSSLVNFYLEIFKRLPPDSRKDLLRSLYRHLAMDPTPGNGEIINWEDARRLDSMGFSIQSHSHTHEIFSVAPEKMLFDELVTSKALIEAEVGHQCTHFCFPNGRYLSANEDILRSSGYSKAFRIDNSPTRPGDNPFFIPRYLIAERYMRMGWLKAELAGLVRR